MYGNVLQKNGVFSPSPDYAILFHGNNFCARRNAINSAFALLWLTAFCLYVVGVQVVLDAMGKLGRIHANQQPKQVWCGVCVCVCVCIYPVFVFMTLSLPYDYAINYSLSFLLVLCA